jgi:hypothetical protein
MAPKNNKFLRIKVNNFGFGVSYFAKTDIVKFYKIANIGIGASLGYTYDNINKVVFHYPENLEEIRNTNNFVSNLGLNYLNNRFFINLELLNFIILEVGIQNRILFYRHLGFKNNNYKGNNNEKENPIPWFYTDFYSSLALKIGKITINYRIFDINKKVMIQDFNKPNTSLGQQKPVIYTISKIHIFSLSIPIKSYKSDKFPLIKF